MVQAAQAGMCGPAPAIRAELEHAAAIVVKDPTAFDQNIAPFEALRKRYPANLFVHERYQDAVEQHGIEGHLRVLTDEYQALAIGHPDDVMYAYLSARSMVGRGTPSAITQLNDILTDHPDFAPAHQTLAEIYSSEAFHDAEKAAAERERFLSSCPRSTLTSRPPALPPPSPLIDQAEKLLADHGEPERVAEMAMQSIRDDEWRLQRIRPFDWYSVEFKRQAQRQLQAEYWRLWSIQVRCYRRAGQSEKASALLEVMEQRAARLTRSPTSAYFEAQATLAGLYIEENQVKQATSKLDALSQFLADHPDPDRTARLGDLKKLMDGPRQ